MRLGASPDRAAPSCGPRWRSGRFALQPLFGGGDGDPGSSCQISDSGANLNCWVALQQGRACSDAADAMSTHPSRSPPEPFSPANPAKPSPPSCTPVCSCCSSRAPHPGPGLRGSKVMRRVWEVIKQWFSSGVEPFKSPSLTLSGPPAVRFASTREWLAAISSALRPLSPSQHGQPVWLRSPRSVHAVHPPWGTRGGLCSNAIFDFGMTVYCPASRSPWRGRPGYLTTHEVLAEAGSSVGPPPRTPLAVEGVAEHRPDPVGLAVIAGRHATA